MLLKDMPRTKNIFVIPGSHDSHVWTVAFGHSLLDYSAMIAWSPALQMFFRPDTVRFVMRGVLRGQRNESFLRKETQKACEVVTSRQSKAFRVELRATVTDAGYTIGELSDLGFGAYKTDTHLITVTPHAGSNAKEYKSGRVRHVEVATIKPSIYKQVVWYVERGVNVKYAEFVNSEQERLNTIKNVGGAIGGGATAMLVANSEVAGNIGKIIDRISKRDVKQIVNLK